MSFFQVNNKCTGCLACVQNCPASALDHRDEGEKRTILHNMTRCARCGNCWRICPEGAIEFQHLLHTSWDEVATMSLIRCAVCGEPLYTMDFEDKLAHKLNKDVEALCPQHRNTSSLIAWKRFLPEKTKSKGLEK